MTGWKDLQLGGVIVWIVAVSLNWVKESYSCWVRWPGSLNKAEQENGGTQKKKKEKKAKQAFPPNTSAK